MPLAKRLRFSVKVSPAYASLLEALGRENPDTKLHVYLITISRAFADTATSIAYRDLETVTKTELADMIRDPSDNPSRLASLVAGHGPGQNQMWMS